MIKRPGQQQLLLPVSPVFMWGSLVVALLINMVPIGRAAWMPTCSRWRSCSGACTSRCAWASAPPSSSGC